MTTTFTLQEYGITVGEVHRNLPPSRFTSMRSATRRMPALRRTAPSSPIPESRRAARPRTSASSSTQSPKPTSGGAR